MDAQEAYESGIASKLNSIKYDDDSWIGDLSGLNNYQRAWLVELMWEDELHTMQIGVNRMAADERMENFVWDMTK